MDIDNFKKKLYDRIGFNYVDKIHRETYAKIDRYAFSYNTGGG